MDVLHESVSSRVLTTFPFIIRSILNGLCAQDLYRSARVCKVWSAAVKFIKQKRNTASWTVDLFEENARKRVKSYIQGLYTEPTFFMMFIQTGRMDGPVKACSPHPAYLALGELPLPMNRPFETFVPSLLPPQCTFIGITADGVVGTSSDLKTVYEVEGEGIEGSVSFLSLPKFEGVDIYNFTADVLNDENDHISLSTSVPESRNVKAVLMFSDRPADCEHIGRALFQLYPGTVLAGGYVDNLLNPKDCLDETEPICPSLSCVAFCGERLLTASIILKSNIRTEQEVETEMKKLKNCKLPEENSFAFMFACVGRGQNHYNKENVETTIFKKYFPNTPIQGFFGNGEIGFNCLTKYNPADGTVENGRRTRPSRIGHSYSTVICLMSVT